MDIGLRKTELRVLDQPLHLVIILPLIDTVRKHLKAIIKGKGQRLWVLLLYFKFFHEFADIQKTKLSSGFIIHHLDRLPPGSNRCRADIPWMNHRKRIPSPTVPYK